MSVIDKSTFKIGIIGFGDMGKLYATKFSESAYRVYVCDLPSKYKDLLLNDTVKHCNLNVCKDGQELSEVCDFIIYSIEASNINKAIKLYAKSTNSKAIVGGQTAVKSIEVEAFLDNLSDANDIITFHSMHGPSVDPKGQPLIVVSQRDRNNSTQIVEHIFKEAFGYKIINLLNYSQHDKVCAVTQAATHVAFLSMGTAWMNRKAYPWKSGPYAMGGIENIKINIALRIYNQKWHVYADLAILNKEALPIIETYTQSVNSLFGLIISGKEEELLQRITTAKNDIFKDKHKPQLIENEQFLDKFKIRDESKYFTNKHLQNSHLSLLAVVDCWYKLNINPYMHQIYETPPFKLFLAMIEKLFLDDQMLKKTIKAATTNLDIREDDLAFCSSVVGWCECIKFRNTTAFKDRFNETKGFFLPILPSALASSNDMIKAIFEHE